MRWFAYAARRGGSREVRSVLRRRGGHGPRARGVSSPSGEVAGVCGPWRTADDWPVFGSASGGDGRVRHARGRRGGRARGPVPSGGRGGEVGAARVERGDWFVRGESYSPSWKTCATNCEADVGGSAC